MRIKKKLVYYVIGSSVLFAILLLSPVVPIDNYSVSVWDILVKYKRGNDYYSEDIMLAACRVGWFAIIMPVIISIPAMSYVYDEIISEFYLKLQAKKGRWGYLFSDFLYGIINGGIFAFIVLTVFCIFIGVFFDSCTAMLVNMEIDAARISVYAMAFSAFSVWCIFIFKNLSFSISIIFTAGYLANKVASFMMEIYLSAAMLLLVFGLYIILWRSGRV